MTKKEYNDLIRAGNLSRSDKSSKINNLNFNSSKLDNNNNYNNNNKHENKPISDDNDIILNEVTISKAN